MIKIIRVLSQELIISTIAKEDEEFLYLKDPFALIPTNDGKLQFIPWSPLSEEDAPVELYKKHVIYYTTPNADVLANYNDIFSNIITPQSAGKIIT